MNVSQIWTNSLIIFSSYEQMEWSELRPNGKGWVGIISAINWFQTYKKHLTLVSFNIGQRKVIIPILDVLIHSYMMYTFAALFYALASSYLDINQKMELVKRLNKIDVSTKKIINVLMEGWSNLSYHL